MDTPEKLYSHLINCSISHSQILPSPSYKCSKLRGGSSKILYLPLASPNILGSIFHNNNNDLVGTGCPSNLILLDPLCIHHHFQQTKFLLWSYPKDKDIALILSSLPLHISILRLDIRTKSLCCLIFTKLTQGFPECELILISSITSLFLQLSSPGYSLTGPLWCLSDPPLVASIRQWWVDCGSQVGGYLHIWLGCCMRTFSMLEASLNLPSLEAWPGLMWCAIGLRF